MKGTYIVCRLANNALRSLFAKRQPYMLHYKVILTQLSETMNKSLCLIKSAPQNNRVCTCTGCGKPGKSWIFQAWRVIEFNSLFVMENYLYV